MRIYAFVSSYPSAYKPYLDMQFADFLDKGHDLRIHALGRIDEVVGEKVHQYGLLRRTHYVLPAELRKLPRFVPAAVRGLSTNPIERLRSVRRLDLAGRRWRDRLKDVVRSLELPLKPPDLCLIHGARVAFSFRWLRELYPGVPVCLYYHGGEPAGAGSAAPEALEAGFAAADIVFTNTRAAAREASGRGCPEERLSILPVGFDLRSYRRRPDRSFRTPEGLRLASVGRLTEGKGHAYAVEAIRRLVADGRDRVGYRIVGDGPERSSLSRAVREAGLEDRIVLTGTLSHEQVKEELGRADVLVHPSVTTETWAETQAVVVQEAMLMGATVVTTRTGGIPESIPDGMREFSVPERDVEAMTSVLTRLYDASREELERLGHLGRDFVERHYDVSRTNEELVERALEGRREIRA